MTEFLASRTRRVIAIETDPALAQALRERTANRPNVEIIESDILTVDLSSLTPDRLRIYGNLPYYITSPILSHLFGHAAQIDSIHIVIQWEVAARIVSAPGHREYAYLSVLCQYFTRPEVMLRIPPGAFRPPPKVNSALLAMKLPGERAHLSIRDDALFLRFLQNCFSQKRKTLRNNLKGHFRDEQIAAALAACNLAAKARAEELSLANFAQIYHRLAPGGQFTPGRMRARLPHASGPDNPS